jgi:hypothetical protein
MHLAISVSLLTFLPSLPVLTSLSFTADELILLVKTLHLLEPIMTSNSYHADALEALALLCTCLCSPKDLLTLSTKYDCSQSTIMQLTDTVATVIMSTWVHLLDFDINGIFSPDTMASYAATLHTHGAPMHTVIGFIDCTICQTCRPIMSQNLVYTGYKKLHGMKFQGVIVPNGMIARLAGLFRCMVAHCSDMQDLS